MKPIITLRNLDQIYLKVRQFIDLCWVFLRNSFLKIKPYFFQIKSFLTKDNLKTLKRDIEKKMTFDNFLFESIRFFEFCEKNFFILFDWLDIRVGPYIRKGLSKLMPLVQFLIYFFTQTLIRLKNFKPHLYRKRIYFLLILICLCFLFNIIIDLFVVENKNGIPLIKSDTKAVTSSTKLK